jgi:hypothetical protein
MLEDCAELDEEFDEARAGVYVINKVCCQDICELVLD